jgi:hypothetical protein
MRPSPSLLVAACLAALAAGCGGEERVEPSQRDVVMVARSIDDIVFQCRSAAAGFIAGPDARTLRRNVDTLVRTYERVRPDAAIYVEGLPGQLRKTTVGEQMRFALRRLRRCAPSQAARVRGALED